MVTCFKGKPLERKIDFVNKLEQSSSLEPEFISGFIDKDGCFCISQRKTKRVDVCFSIVAVRENLPLLLEFKKYFGVGNVYNVSEKTSRYMGRLLFFSMYLNIIS